MRLRADEHVAPGIVTAIREMSLSSGWILDSVREAGQRGTSDVHWITQFMRDGGEAILTADRDFCEDAPQIAAVFATGAKVIHLPSKWAQAKGHLQAAHVLMWWPRIEDCIQRMKSRECFRPPWNIHLTGDLQKVPLDLQAAERRLKRANRPARRAE